MEALGRILERFQFQGGGGCGVMLGGRMVCFEGNPLVVVAKAIYVREFPERNKRLNLHTLSTWESLIKVNLVLV